ncbi:MAG: hypothetical protein J7M25_02030 [Deltaproteobacteria bacterium]|nr:hypothetical protein [Deltaproteobacteria bacterium]
MKDVLHELVGRADDPRHNLNLVRECLQARVPESMQRSGSMVVLEFHGGIAFLMLDAWAIMYSDRSDDWTGRRDPG